MNRTISPSPRRGLLPRAMSKPELARLILVATTAIVAATLAAWLWLWLLVRTPGGVDALWMAQDGASAPWSPFREQDVRNLRNDRPASATPEGDLRATLADLVNRRGRGAIVIYLAAPGLAFGGKPYFLPADEAPFATSQSGEEALVQVKAILEALAASPSRKKLLILDASQVGSDRDLGAFGNDVPRRVAELVRAEQVPGLAVLLSSAPGQVSWASETDRRSIFGHFVAEGLAGKAAAWDPSGRITVHGLSRYVSRQVARWVDAHRQAKQTPVLIGDVSANFPLRRQSVVSPSAPEEVTEEFEAVMKRLADAWARRDARDRSAPSRHDPIAWRQFLDGLLRAEHLLRAGRLDDAGRALDALGETEARLSRRGDDPRSAVRPWSLALGRRLAEEAPSRKELPDALKAGDRAIPEALASLTGRVPPSSIAPAPVASPARGVRPAPGDPAKATEAPPTGEVQGGEVAPDAPQAKATAATLTDRGRDGIPSFVESQPLVWAIRLAVRPGAPDFRGERGELLGEAIDARRLIEDASSRDDRALRRIGPLLALAVARLRDGQDLLFGAQGTALGEAAERLADASERSRLALEHATLVAQGADLIDRIAAELPYYGAWLARRDRGLDPALEDVLAEAAALADDLAADPPALEESSWREAASRDREALGRRVAKVRAGFADLTGRFQSLVKLAAASSGAPRWRELDDLLRVPTIPAALRMELLAKVRSADLTPPLIDHTEEVPTEDAPLPVLPGSEGAPEGSASGAEVEPDPRFWSEAAALATIEWALLAIGGAESSRRDELRRLADAARAARDDPSASASALDRFTTLAREVRVALSRAVQAGTSGPDGSRPDDEAARALAAADRAARVLPLAFVRALPEGSSPAHHRDRFLRYEALTALGRRLTDDFASDHALLVLDDARRLHDSRDLSAVVERARREARSTLELAADPAVALTLGQQDGTLAVRVTARGDLPPGRATLLVEHDDDAPVFVAIAGSDGVAEAGDEPLALVTVPPSGPSPESRRYLLRRTAYGPDTDPVELRPAAFYRGHLFEADSPLRVAFEAGKEDVDVTIRDRDFARELDQFQLHPGRGYLHYGATLNYKLILTNQKSTPLKLWVSYALDGQDPQERTLNLAPGMSDENIEGSLRSVDLGPIKPDAPPPPVGNDEVPVFRPRVLTVLVREGDRNGRALAMTRKYEFYQMPVDQYAAAHAQFDPNRGRVWVYAHHLPTDRVTGPLKFQATIGGAESDRVIMIPKGRHAFFWIPVFPPYPEKIKWSVTAGLKPSAFTGEVETGIAPPTPPAEAPSAGPKL